MINRVAKRTKSVATGQSTFDTCVIVCNPASTQAAQAHERIQQLQKQFPEKAVTLIYTSPDGHEANKLLLRAQADKLHEHTLLAIAGGDGTVSFVINTLLGDEHFTMEMRRATILPLWGGNGNDLACMLNGAPPRQSFAPLLRSGKRVAIYPLRCETITNNETSTRMAVCYASFGASALAARELESLRGVRPFFHAIGAAKFVHELSMVVRTLLSAPGFIVDDGESTPKTIHDRLFINGSRFAKVSGVPLRLTDRQFCYITVEQKRVASMAFHITELIRKHPGRYVVTDGRTITFALREATWAQIDGEVMHLDIGTYVRVGEAEQPFYALSTSLTD